MTSYSVIMALIALLNVVSSSIEIGLRKDDIDLPMFAICTLVAWLCVLLLIFASLNVT